MLSRGLARISSPADREAFIRCLRVIAGGVVAGEVTFTISHARVCDVRVSTKAHSTGDDDLGQLVATQLALDMRPRPESET